MTGEADFLKALGEPTRLRLVTLLTTSGEICVCQLAEALEEPDFKISRHLSVLRSAGVVQARREGTWMYYRLVNQTNSLASCIYACLQSCLSENRAVKRDLKLLMKASCQTV